MMDTSYSWRDGARFKVDADVAAKELDKCKDEKGIINAKDVVNVARESDNPLHPEFEWDDAFAAEEHRKHTARVMASSLIVTLQLKQIEPVYIHAEVHETEYKPLEPVEQIVTRALVHDVLCDNHGYRWINPLTDDKAAYARLLVGAKRDAHSYALKYRTINEVADIIKAIDSTIPKDELVRVTTNKKTKESNMSDD
ncbi:hypothetical protein AGMMS49992_29600 [Clostridia bacterium]|nr:hypothetical protein AGMMS49992_29600 [Clostridia bacterium]